MALECAIITQRATKILRFGTNETQPGQPLCNTERLSIEIGDLLEVIDHCIDAGLLNCEVIQSTREKKRIKIKKYMQTTP